MARHLGAPGDRALVDADWKRRLRLGGKATLELVDRRDVDARCRGKEQAEDCRERAVRDCRPMVSAVSRARRTCESVEDADEAAPLGDPEGDRLVERDTRIPERARGNRWAKALRRSHKPKREVEPRGRDFRVVC
jgi:hypothetical protein